MSNGSVLVPGADGAFLHSGAVELDRKLREGDGTGWTGDRHLFLAIGVAEETRSGRKTGRIARRYEVHREYDDGRTELIGHWRMEEFDRILYDLAIMRAGAEGRTEGVLDRIDKSNAEIEAEQSRAFRDSYGEMLDHAARLTHDLQEGRSTFRQVGGLRDEPKG